MSLNLTPAADRLRFAPDRPRPAFSAGQRANSDHRLRRQSPSSVLLIRPHRFTPNPSTAEDNTFFTPTAASEAQREHRARAEVTTLARTLQRAGIRVDLWEDPGTNTPDSVFPNNWFSLHGCGRLVLYPMWAANRRAERREEIIDHLCARYQVTEVINLTGFESQDQFLEGTGAMVFDHLNRTVYACRSQRMSEPVLRTWCEIFDYEPVIFDAYDGGKPVYHSNVLLSLGTSVALLGAELIPQATQRQELRRRLVDSGRDVVELSAAQVRSFAANALELAATPHGRNQPAEAVLAMSARAHGSLGNDQRARLAEHAELLISDVSTIETAGGSTRCMLAGLQAPARLA